MSAIEAVFSWLLCCQMPLSTGGFCKAISCTLDHCPALTPIAILDMCSSFVVVDKTLDMFRFVHLSVQEYLLSKEPYSKPLCHSRILLSCLNFLSTDDFRTSPHRHDQSRVGMPWQYQGAKANLECPAPYMIPFWPRHLDLSEEYGHSDLVLNQLSVFFHQSFAEWIETTRIIVLPGELLLSSFEPRLGRFLKMTESQISHYEPRLELLLGIPEYYRYMELAQTRASCPNPLSAIIVLGCAEVLERGLDVNINDLCNGVKPLLWACQHRNFDAVRWLLQHGADPNEQSSHSSKQPLLLGAVKKQDVAVTRVMVSKGTLHTVEKEDSHQINFIWASHSHDWRLKQLLDDHAVDNQLWKILRDAHLNDAQTARVKDFFRRNHGVLKLSKNNRETPIHDAVTKNYPFESGRLAEHGARLSDKAPIDVALRLRDLPMLSLLLSYGAEVNEQILRDWCQPSTSGPPSPDDCRSVNEVFAKHGIPYRLPGSCAEWRSSSHTNAIGKPAYRGRQLMAYLMGTWLYCRRNELRVKRHSIGPSASEIYNQAQEP